MALAAPPCFPLGVALRYGEPVVPFLAAILTTVVAGTDVLGHPVDAMFEALGGAASTVLDIGPAVGDAGPTAHTLASRSPRGWQWSS